nr:MAG TPA: Protein of unknown function (DUF4236) [Caudoviricetes sp.]
MGLRFRNTIKIAPGVKLNISKSGISTSIGERGNTVNISKRGVRSTIGIPGTGISYSTMLTGKKKRKTAAVPSTARRGPIGTFTAEGGYNCAAGYVKPEVVEFVKEKEWCEHSRALAWCASVFGIFGAHRYYVGKVGTGLLYTFTLGFGLIGWFIDLLSILSGGFRDKDGAPLIDESSYEEIPFLPPIPARKFSWVRFGFYVPIFAALAYFVVTMLPGAFTKLIERTSYVWTIVDIALMPTFFSGLYLFCRRKLKAGEEDLGQMEVFKPSPEAEKSASRWSTAGKWSIFAMVIFFTLAIALTQSNPSMAGTSAFVGALALILTIGFFTVSHQKLQPPEGYVPHVKAKYVPPSPLVDDPCFGPNLPEEREGAEAFSALFAEYKDDIRRHNWLKSAIHKGYIEANQGLHDYDQVAAWIIEDIPLVERLNSYLKKWSALAVEYCGGTDNPTLDAVPLYKRLAIIYEKQGKYDEAIQVCRDAIAKGLTDDKMQGGFESRIEKLEKLK